MEKLQQEPELVKLFDEIEMPLVGVLSRIERNGVLIDPKKLLTQSAEIEKRLEEVETLVHAEAGQTFNLASTKQLQEILFEKLGLPVLKKTPKGAPSTNEEVLDELAQQGHLVPKLLMEHRGLSKLKSTYTDKLPQLINKKTGRVHTSYNQAVTATGRLLPAIRICRTFRSAMKRADGFAKLLSREKVIKLSLPTIHKLSYGLWLIYRMMRE